MCFALCSDGFLLFFFRSFSILHVKNLIIHSVFVDSFYICSL